MKGYRYLDGTLTALHVTSVPQTDEEAFAYIEKVESWFPGTRVEFMEKRQDEPLADYELMAIEIEDGKVTSLVDATG